MRITGGSPNLINGVSRQPPEVRLTSQLQDSLNLFPTITKGLVRRPPAMLKGVIPGTAWGNQVAHFIDRDSSERYYVRVNPSDVKVHKLDGSAVTVNAPSGWGYLAGVASRDDYEILTVQDHTFIVNRTKVVSKLADTTPAPVSRGLVHIVAGDYHTDYKIFLNGTLAAHYKTLGGPLDSTADARKAEAGARTSAIARCLVSVSPADAAGLLATSVSTLSGTSASQYTFQLFDNVICITRTDGSDFALEVEAGSETRMRAHKGQSAKLSELPRKAPDGFLIKVEGDQDTDFDDYYVKFSKPSTSAQGSWVETQAPSAQYALDPATMPHVLVREADGTFTFKPGPWEGRAVGDDSTNPWPSFVGQKIRGIAFGNNRLGFSSGESLAQSRHGEFFNFWVHSVIAPLDTDPIDAAISYPEVSTIHHVVPFAGETVLFTESAPFRMSGGDALTQKNIHFDHLVSSKVSPYARPATAGSKLFYATESASGCFISEFRYDRAADSLTAESVTDHVAGYLPSRVTMMEASDALKTLAVFSENDNRKLYIYKWLTVDGNRVQSAWQSWSFAGVVQGFRFIGEELIVAAGIGDQREIYSINMHEAWSQGFICPIYLDRQTAATGTYLPGEDATSYTLPYPASGAIAYATAPNASFGTLPTVASTSGNTIKLAGDTTSMTLVFGFNYTSSGTLSPLLHRSQNGQGGYGNALPGFKTTISNVRLGCSDTHSIITTISREGRDDYVETSAVLGDSEAVLKRTGTVRLGRINKSISVLGSAARSTVSFQANGPYPFSILSYAWTGDAAQVTY